MPNSFTYLLIDVFKIRYEIWFILFEFLVQVYPIFDTFILLIFNSKLRKQIIVSKSHEDTTAL